MSRPQRVIIILLLLAVLAMAAIIFLNWVTGGTGRMRLIPYL